MAFRILSFMGFGRKTKEQEIIDLLTEHLKIVSNTKCVLAEIYELAFKGKFDAVAGKIKDVFELERDADQLKKKITIKLHEGAFLPTMRRNLYDLILINDVVCNEIQNAASMFGYLKIFKLPKSIWVILGKLIDKSCESVDQLQKTFIALTDYNKDIDKEIVNMRKIESEADSWQKELFETMYFKIKRDALMIMAVGQLGHFVSEIADRAQEASEKMMLIRIMKQS
ncbi:DUF47 family protein [Candidatus Woesearchaeota archaeon]|nr:DUF47 family protein [Candidatus Woesearchaeota archaeon]